MFTYELQQERRNELQHQAEAWRLARDAKAARTAERRAARRDRARARIRTDAEGVPSPHAPLGGVHRVIRALHPRSAA